MRRTIRREEDTQVAINPFDNKGIDTELLMKNLNVIDESSIRYKFKNTTDPINLAFETIGEAPLKILAKEFVKDSLNDITSFISKICK